MICSFYAHEVGINRITTIVKKVYPRAKFKITQDDEYQVIEIIIKDGFFSSSKIITIPYRERTNLSYQIPSIDDCDLTANIRGMHGLVDRLEADDIEIQGLLLRKIETLNCEFSIIETKGNTKEIKDLIYQLAQTFDAILFVQSETFLSRAFNQHFSNKDLQLLMDTSGMCGDGKLDVKIQSKYFEAARSLNLTENQKARKISNEEILKANNIKYISHLPTIESEEEVTIRSPKEIAERVTILAMVNYVAFNTISGKEAIEVLKKSTLWDKVTPNEKTFLINPTEDEKTQRTWQCEAIWTLFWALGQIEELGFPYDLCHLDNIEYYPFRDANCADFINTMSTARSKSEILDANDLYYRFSWACTDARIKGQQVENLNSSVVYERHYALNWLIHYQNQDWDDVSCDT